MNETLEVCVGRRSLRQNLKRVEWSPLIPKKVASMEQFGPMTAPSFTIGDLFYFLGSVAFLMVMYMLFRQKLSSSKLRCWILTAINSIVTPLLSIRSLFRIVNNNWEYGFVTGGSRSSRICTIFFMAYLCCELIVGSIEYRKYVTFVMGYIHHVTYLLLCLHLLAKNRTNVMSMMLLEELPTLILAAGRLGQYFHSDFAFAASFIVTRICFHLYVQYNMYLLRDDEVMGRYWHVLGMGFALNAYWLLAWWKSVQRRKARTHGSSHKRRSKRWPTSSMPTVKSTRARFAKFNLQAKKVNQHLSAKFRMYRHGIRQDIKRFTTNRMDEIHRAKSGIKQKGKEVGKAAKRFWMEASDNMLG